MLTTEQRIPGLGNGVLQDILFNAGIRPKRELSTFGDLEKDDLFHNLKTTIPKKTFSEIRAATGRFCPETPAKNPCPNCGSEIAKEAYLGGVVYYCPVG